MDSKEPHMKELHAKLSSSRKDPKALCQVLQEIIDRIDSINDTTARDFLKGAFDDLVGILEETPPVMEENFSHYARANVAKLIQKVCTRQTPMDMFDRIVEKLLQIADEDNEENAVLSVKIVQELIQKSNPGLPPTVIAKVDDFLGRLFKSFEARYQKNFGPSIEAASLVASVSHVQEGQSDTAKPKLKLKAPSKDSFKIFSDSHTITVIMIGLSSKNPDKKIVPYLSQIITALSFMPDKEIQQLKKEKFLEFAMAQSRLYSIVDYLLRISGAFEALRHRAADIAQYSLKFIKNCPGDSNLRRSFLAAFRNLITSFIDQYLDHLPEIFDLDILIGSSIDRYDLKPEASKIIVHVAHHVRTKLRHDQELELILHALMRIINDTQIALAPQSNALIVINKYIEDLWKMADKQRILLEILQALTLKFKYMAKYLPKSCDKRMASMINEGNKGVRGIEVLNSQPEEAKEKPAEARPRKELDFYVETGKAWIKIENDREKELAELLNETKSLMQKSIALAHSVIGCLCDNAKATLPNRNCHLCERELDQISKLFHSGIKYFIAKASLYRLFGKNFAVEEQDLEKNIKNFIDAFVNRLDLASFEHVMEKEIGFLYKCITKPRKLPYETEEKKTLDNDFLIKICTNMKDLIKTESLKPFSTAFALILAKYLLKKFKSIGGYKKMASDSQEDSQKYEKTLLLFKAVMEMLPMLGEDENVNVLYFNFIVLSAKYSRKARSFYNYFSVIKTVCKAILAKQRDPPKAFAALMPGLISTILNARQDCGVANELLTEICLYFPVNLRNLIEYLPALLRPLIDCVSSVKIGSQIVLTAIKSFEQWLAALDHFPEIMDSLFAPILPEFIGILHKLFVYQNYAPSIHKILGKFGGKSRLYLIDKEAYIKSYPDDGIRMVIKERTAGMKIVVGMDIGLDASFRHLETNAKLRKENIKSIYKLVKAAYFYFIDSSYDASYIRSCFEALSKHNFAELRQLAEECALKQFNSSESQIRVSAIKRDSQKHVLEKLLTEIFYMTAVYYTREGYTKKLVDFFYFICEHLVLIGLCRNGQLTLGQMDETDPQIYLNTITDFLNESRDALYPSQKSNQITYVALEAIAHIAKTYAAIYENKTEHLNKVQLLDLLLQKIYALCYWKEWTKKEGSSLALSMLMDILPKAFFYPYEVPIVEALLFAINNLPKSITVTAHQTVPDALYKVLKTCHTEPHLRKEGEGRYTILNPALAKSLREVVRALCAQLKSEKKLMRTVASKCLEYLTIVEELPLKDLMTLDTIQVGSASSGGSEKMMIRESLDINSEPILTKLNRSIFSQKKWSEEFKKYNYSEISSHLECLSYLLSHDTEGDLIGVSAINSDSFYLLNSELLEIIKEEITSFEEKKKLSTESSIQNSYMLIEKYHYYFHPIYEQSVSTVYNYPIRSEKQRLAEILAESKEQALKKEGKATRVLRAEAMQISGQDDDLSRYTAEIMKIKDQTKRPNMLKGDSYIYKVYPKSESRLKAVCKCMIVLCDEFEKFKKDPAFFAAFCQLEKTKEEIKQQRFKYTVALLRLLLRDEKCIIHTAKVCMKRMIALFPEKDELLPGNVFILYLKQSLQSKYSDLAEYKKMMHIVKLFPKHFGEGLWRKFAESLAGIKQRLTENFERQSRFKSDTEFVVASYIISSYRHMDYLPGYNPSFFAETIEHAEALDKLLYLYGRADVSYKGALAKIFNKFSAVALDYLRKNTQKLQLFVDVAQAKQAKAFVGYMSQNALEFFEDIIKTNASNATKSVEKYLNMHYVLSLVYIIDKRLGVNVDWLRRIQRSLEVMGRVWIDFKEALGEELKIDWYLRQDFRKLQKLLLKFSINIPSAPSIPFLLLGLFRHCDYIDTHELKQFFCFELPEKIPSEAIPEYIHQYARVISAPSADEELQCYSTSYIMIPLLFRLFKVKAYEAVINKELEEETLKAVFGERSQKLSVQKRLIRLATLILENLTYEKMDQHKKLITMDIWSKIKSEDIGVKAWALLALARFASKKAFPNQRIQEVIYFFLAEPMGEQREIINEALDTLVPIMYPRPGPQLADTNLHPHKKTPSIDQINLLLLERVIKATGASLPTLHNVFSMIVRNSEVFKPNKSGLYSRMIQAFQKIFFFAQPLFYKQSAFEIARTMLSWSGDPSSMDSNLKETEIQIKEIILNRFFKELFFQHSIYSGDESLEREPTELTYKCLALFKSILKSNPGISFKISSSFDKPSIPYPSKEAIVHLTILNTARIILRYCRKDYVEEILKRLIDGVKITLQCRWGGKIEPQVQQKHPQVIESIIKFLVLLNEIFPMHGDSKSLANKGVENKGISSADQMPANPTVSAKPPVRNFLSDIVSGLLVIIKWEINNFKSEQRQFDKNIREEEKSGTTAMPGAQKAPNSVAGAPQNQQTAIERSAALKEFREKIFFLTPHLAIRLLANHEKLGLSEYFVENLDEILNCIMYLSKVFAKYLKNCKKAGEEPYAKGDPQPFARQTPQNQGQPGNRNSFGVNMSGQVGTSTEMKEYEWEWLKNTDPDITIIQTGGFSMDVHTRDTIIQAIHLLTPSVFTDSTKRNKYIEMLVVVLEKECLDETITVEVIKCARKILLGQAISKVFASGRFSRIDPYTDLDKSRVLWKLLEAMPSDFEIASNELFELAHEFLSQVVDIKDYHKRLLHYSLLQLRTKSLPLKKKFFKLFEQYFGSSLFKKFECIFFMQKWTDIKDQRDAYWIQQALDLLLSSICDNDQMQRDPDCLVVLNFASKPMLPLAKVDRAPKELEAIISKYEREIEKMKKKSAKFWLDPLKDAINWETHTCERMWLKLFPQFWNLMSPDEQQQLACFIEPFIIREEHIKACQGKKQNPIKTILEGLAACDPMPKLAPEIIQFIGKNYGAWHTAIPVLESYLYAFPNNERMALCLQELYRRLSEKDYVLGLQKLICKSIITQAGLGYLLCNMWEPAFDLFASAISKYIKCNTDSSTLEYADLIMTAQGELKKSITQMDLRVWEDGLIESAQQLNQWELIETLNIPKTKLLLTYHWSRRNWQNYLLTASNFGESEDSTTMLAALYNYMESQKEEEGEARDNIYKKGLKSVYSEWNLLPSVADVSHYNSIILQQHYLESNEFKIFCKDIKDMISKQPGPDVKSSLNVWRERLPNKCEPFSVWKDLLECRNFMFKTMLNKFKGSRNFEYCAPVLHDIPWNLLKLAEISSKHRLIDQTLNYLTEASSFLKESGNSSYEKFILARETAKVALRFDYLIEEGIRYLESVENKEYSTRNPASQSEIFRLKGKLFAKRNKRSNALEALKKSTELCSTNYQAWLSYAQYCDKLYFDEKKDPTHAMNAMKGYINATAYMISKSKFLIPKILCFFDPRNIEQFGETKENACKYIEDAYIASAETIPTWVWIYWIPQLLSNLSKSQAEGKISLNILERIARLYPQPLCLHLYRLMQRCENGLEKGREDLLAILRLLLKIVKEIDREALKAEQIKTIFDELERSVLTSLNKEDELLIHMRKLLNTCIPICETSIKAVSEAFRKIHMTFFGTGASDPIQVLYKEKFEKDFNKTAVEERPLAKTLMIVNNWIGFLHTKVGFSLHASAAFFKRSKRKKAVENIIVKAEQKSMNEYSRVLANMNISKLEMFGCNYNKDIEPAPETNIYITRIEAKVDRTLSRTKIELKGSNEKVYGCYLEFYYDNEGASLYHSNVNGQPGHSEKMEVQLSQLRQILNHYFCAKRNAHIRNVKLYTPYCIYWNKMRVTMDDSSMIKMKDIHDASLIERGYHPDLAVILYLEKYLSKLQPGSPTALLGKDEEKELLHSVNKEMKIYFPDHVFASYIHKLISSPDELFIYKKQFTAYLAAQSFFTYLFGLINKDFSTFLLCKKTGKLYFTASEFQSKVMGVVSRPESAVPFRLTPNLSNFITQIGILGPFAGAFSSATYIFEGNKGLYLCAILKLFFQEVLEKEEAKSIDIIKKNCDRVIKESRILLDPEVIKKLFNCRHQIFKPESPADSIGQRAASGFAPEEKAEDDGGYWKPFDYGVSMKIQEAMSESRLENMKLEWAPWF